MPGHAALRAYFEPRDQHYDAESYPERKRPVMDDKQREQRQERRAPEDPSHPHSSILS